ncbi:hypothetical protein I8748_09725 [Nostoc sp. CENA67]|uniref:Uncharacterized protein n=1 Tax=Amazonocrinis nigriterrae CENA67 TaxID=2794033 RepID=A0A8J7HTW5_9NOST|nr:hypothetical protein [Amazonocrinis nigriterrae]MBH8562449.1 hypothetical protein [Amazonocrinis nigriterrae CENA67]
MFRSLPLDWFLREGISQGFQKNNWPNLPVGIEMAFVTDDIVTAFALAIETGAVVIVNLKAKY